MYDKSIYDIYTVRVHSRVQTCFNLLEVRGNLVFAFSVVVD